MLIGAVVIQRVSTATARDATSATVARSIVGTRILDTDTTALGRPTGVITVAAVGTDPEGDADGTIGLGGWRSTGERTAVLIRPTVAVDEDGYGFTATYTFEELGLDDKRPGECGPGEEAGVGLGSEAPGTLVGTLEDRFFLRESTPEP